MNLMGQIKQQEKRWRRAQRIERKHKKKLFSLLEKKQVEARKRNESR